MGATLPAGSTVEVAPMFVIGQQAPQLSFTGAIALRSGLDGALVRAWVRTNAQRCMGGGQARVDFHGGQCILPYTTTHVEFEVFDVNTQRAILEVSGPAVYHFAAE